MRSFETVADMQAATDLAVGMVAHTNGFHTSGDGGAAYYTISASGTANGMDVLACQGGLFATLVNQTDTLNVMSIGMHNDGTTTGNTAIYDAMVTKGYRKFYFPSGTYLINVVVDKKMTEIHGAGIGNEYETGRTVFLPENTSLPYVVKMDNSAYSLENCRVSSIVIDGNGATSGILFSGQALSYSNDWHVFSNLYITGCDYGIHVAARMTSCDFISVMCYQCAIYGLYVEPENTNNLNRFVSCTFKSCGTCGIYWNSSTTVSYVTRGTRFESCDIENNGRNATPQESITAYGIYYNGINALTIAGCYIENNGPSGDSNAAAVYFGENTIEGVSIVGNIIWGSAYAIYIVRGNRNNIAINGNRVSGKVEALANGIGGFNGASIDSYSGLNVPSYNNFLNPNVIQNPLHITTADYGSATDSTLRYTTTADTEAPDMTSKLSIGRVIIFIPLGAGSFIFKRTNGYMLKDDAASLTITANKCIAFVGIYNGYHELWRSV